MKKFTYEYIIFTNNLNYGRMKVKDGFKTLEAARYYLASNNIITKYGCCDIEKKRKYL